MIFMINVIYQHAINTTILSAICSFIFISERKNNSKFKRQQQQQQQQNNKHNYNKHIQQQQQQQIVYDFKYHVLCYITTRFQLCLHYRSLNSKLTQHLHMLWNM